MKYKTPELTTITSAVNTIQGIRGNLKIIGHGPDQPVQAYDNEIVFGYVDWE